MYAPERLFNKPMVAKSLRFLFAHLVQERGILFQDMVGRLFFIGAGNSTRAGHRCSCQVLICARLIFYHEGIPGASQRAPP